MTVSVSRDRSNADRRIISFSPEQRKRAATMRELLGMQNGFDISRGEHDQLSYFGLKNIVYTIDGVEQSADVIDRPHRRFARVEVHQYPGGKYQEYDVWVDIITDPTYIGFEGNLFEEFDTRLVRHALKDLRYHDTKAYFAFQSRRWNFSLQAGDIWSRATMNGEADAWFKFTDIRWYLYRVPGTPANNDELQRRWSASFSADYKISDKSSASLVYNYDGSNNLMRRHFDILQQGPAGEERFVETQHNKYRQGTHSFGLFYRNHEHRVEFNTDLNYRFTPATNLEHTDRTSSDAYVYNYRYSDNLGFLRYNLDALTRFCNDQLTLTAGYVTTWKTYRRRDYDTRRMYNKNGYLRHKVWAKAWMRWKCGLQTAASLWTEATRVYNNGDSYGQKAPLGGSVELYMPLKNGAWTRLDYNCSVDYPDRSSSQQWGYFSDSLTWVHGNPDLKSNTTHHITYKLDLFRALNIAAGFNYAPNRFANVTQRTTIDGRECVEQTTRNTRWSEAWAAISLSKDLGKGFFYKADLSGSHYHSRYHEYATNGWGYRFSTSLNYWLRPLDMDFTIWYNINHANDSWPQYDRRTTYESPGLQVRKKWLKGRLVLGLKYDYMFHLFDSKDEMISDTPYLYHHSIDHINDRRRHTVEATLRWTFSGGHSMRRYDKEMSDEQ